MVAAMAAQKPQRSSGLTHAHIWDAIDRLAQTSGLSPSGLARRSGLDATSFNPSKRIGRDGRPRWPSTESIAKILTATDTDVVAFMSGVSGLRRLLPAMSLSSGPISGRFDASGRPTGDAWEKVDFGGVDDPAAFVLVVGDESLRPLYRAGDHLVVSPGEPVRPGDRVVLARRTGTLMVRELVRRTQRRIETATAQPDAPPEVMPASDMAWIARIVWASQ
jgi:phage repressor protein C with HTH and peptisase S24 domain